MVAKLTERAAEYAEAQAIRFDRSSDSMESEDSRTFPTGQAETVGNFLLAHSLEKSDKSAMASVDKIRLRLREAMKARGDSPIAVARDLHVGRDYIRDFLEGKKASLKTDVALALAEKYSLDIRELIPTREAAEIRRGARIHFYITEHMEDHGWDDEKLAGRMDTDAETVAKWRANPQDWQIPAFLHAFGMDDVSELARPPESRKPKKHQERKRA
jgi:hypothetical protein